MPLSTQLIELLLAGLNTLIIREYMTNSSLFDFHLIDTQDIVQTRLSWFWLTDGFYWMNVDGQKLFENSEEALRYWEKEGYNYPKHGYQKCMDYQVVRLWEDIIEILPTIIQPVPREFHQLLSQSLAKIVADSDLFYDYVDSINDTSEYKANNKYFDKPFYLDDHSLSTTHIGLSPYIYFWRYKDANKDNMHIAWDFSQTITTDSGEEIPMWSANIGHFEMPYKSFMQEFNGFHNRLMDAMVLKTVEIENNPELQALLYEDYNLRKEHSERTESVERQFKEYPVNFDWDEMIDYHKKAKIL